MKKILFCIMTIGILTPFTHAQQFELTPKSSGDLTIEIQNLFADLVIEGTSEKAIHITAKDYEGIPEKAKGLTPLSAIGPENTGIGLNVAEDGNVVSISGAIRKADEAKYTIKIPRDAHLVIDYNSYQAGDVWISSMTGEVEVESKVGELYLKDVTGPIVANTLSSNIELVFSSLSQNSPTSLSSTSGDIDVTLASDAKGSFKLRSVSGEVYTDLEFEFAEEENNMRRWGGGAKATADLNGGGVEVSVSCISGDIFLRKK